MRRLLEGGDNFNVDTQSCGAWTVIIRGNAVLGIHNGHFVC